ncbi:ribonuclease T [Catenovulum sediminis]|uniref:ribonuclease T n=1 Tax=Catenovulum sediminis TaxID=1740262 RepID=UPI00118103A0|nr:ribonuclease T [Catenovulum sediminis]
MQKAQLKNRFRGYYPVVIDVETAGFDAKQNALLEIAATLTEMDEEGNLYCGETVQFNVEPFAGAILEKSALEFNGIDPHHPLRAAVDEKEALSEIFKKVRKRQKHYECQRSIMVAHNAAFDMSFLNAAIARSNIKRSPFHPFVSFDTTSLAGLTLGQTVLVKACQAAGIPFDNKEAHSALYDTQKTAELFCFMVNKWKSLGGWQEPVSNSDAVKEE